MRICCAIVLGLSALAGAEVVDAQEEKGAEGEETRMPLFEALDKDDDGKISREEFRGPEEIFKLLDADKDGSVSREEFAKARGAFARRRVERIKAMDKDGDGKVSREEFRGPACAFARLDANHDGSLAPEEIKKGVAASRLGGDRQGGGDRPGEGDRGTGRDPFWDADKDGDGKISRDEARALFDRLDADHDGFVTREELRQAARHDREGRDEGRHEPDGDRPAGKDRDRDEPKDHPEGKGTDKPSR